MPPSYISMYKDVELKQHRLADFNRKFKVPKASRNTWQLMLCGGQLETGAFLSKLEFSVTTWLEK